MLSEHAITLRVGVTSDRNANEIVAAGQTNSARIQGGTRIAIHCKLGLRTPSAPESASETRTDSATAARCAYTQNRKLLEPEAGRAIASSLDAGS